MKGANFFNTNKIVFLTAGITLVSVLFVCSLVFVLPQDSRPAEGATSTYNGTDIAVTYDNSCYSVSNAKITTSNVSHGINLFEVSITIIPVLDYGWLSDSGVMVSVGASEHHSGSAANKIGQLSFESRLYSISSTINFNISLTRSGNIWFGSYTIDQSYSLSAGYYLIDDAIVTFDSSLVYYQYPYTIAYNGNGATGGGMANSNHNYGISKNLTTNNYTRTGYTFAGWSTTMTGGVVYTDGQNVSNLATTSGEVVTLYAVWTPITYTIVYNGNGATGGSTASSTHTYDVEQYLTENGYNKIGYHFLGWARSANGDLEYLYSEIVKNLTAVNGATVNLYAKWTPNIYTVIFDYNGATGGNSAASKSVIYDSAYGELPTPIRSGMLFEGWYLENNFLTRVTSATFVNVADNHTLYAKWKSLVLVHASGATTDFEYTVKFYDEDDSIKVVITPATNFYVSEFSLDNTNYLPAKYYSQALGYSDYGYAFCFSARQNNKIYFTFECINLTYIQQHPINIYIKIASGTNSALTDDMQAVDGINVTATYGGMVSLIGDDFENLSDSDMVTFVANVCVDGYTFSHWESASGINLGADESIKFKKSDVMNKIIKAVFLPINNDLINNDKNN